MKMSEQINELATALVVAQGLIQNPTKSVKNDFFKSKYADLAGVIDVCRPAFTEAGIAVIQSPSTDDSGNLSVTTTLVHTSGQWMSEQISMAIDPNAKNPAQAAGSLITYLRRYSLSAFANVAQEDDDGNSLAGNVKTIDHKADDLKAYNAACDELRDSINAVIEGIEDGTPEGIKHAAQAFFELSEDEVKSIWRAPTKGGCFTVPQVKIIKSPEFRLAHFGKEKENATG